MLKHILPLIPRHRIYTEAFCGGAAVLFAKRPAEAEFINDINMELTNFYWCAQVYYDDLKREIDKNSIAVISTRTPPISMPILSSSHRPSGHGPCGRFVRCRSRR